MTIPLLFAAIVVLIGLSGFFSMSEMVFSSANQLRLENAVDNGVPGAKIALHILTRFDDTLSSVLVGNNLVNIATSSIGSVIAVTLWGEQWTWVMTLVLTVAVIIFGETMPKIIAKKNANRLVLILCYPVRILTVILKPVTVIVVWLVGLIMKLLPAPHVTHGEDEAQQELQSLIETAEDENVLDKDQSELLQAALAFDDTSVSEIMTARVDIEAIDIDDPVDESLSFVRQSTYSRIPVYEDSIDHIIGILSQNRLYRLLAAGEAVDIRDVMTQPIHLYKTTRLPGALHAMREARQHMALVLDEYGGLMGIITIEDIMEELVGDIWDEKDEVEPEELVEHADGVYELDGDMSISDFADLLECREEQLDAESATIGGLTTELHGNFPEPGDCVTILNAEIRVLEMDGMRVDRVLVTVKEKEEEE